MVAGHRVRTGAWQLIEAGDRPGRPPGGGLIAWSWAGEAGADRHVVVVNLSGEPAAGLIRLDWPDLRGRGWRLADLLTGAAEERDGGDLAGAGLPVALGPWQFRLLALR